MATFQIGNLTLESEGDNFAPPAPKVDGPPAPTADRNIYKQVMLTYFSNIKSKTPEESIGYIRQAVMSLGTIWQDSMFWEIYNLGKRAKAEASAENPNNFASESAFLTKLQEILDNDANIASLWYFKLKTAYNALDFNDLKSKMPLNTP